MAGHCSFPNRSREWEDRARELENVTNQKKGCQLREIKALIISKCGARCDILADNKLRQ
ncbi:hypothetical protein LguiB_031302 [Lonicera macranthoides]